MTTTTSPEYTPFRRREIRFHGLREVAGYRLKLHSILYGDEPLDLEGRFAGGWPLVEDALPRPAVDGPRPGVGFVIAHQGATADYLIACWWDNENELPTRVFVRDRQGWRPGNERESFCVWDLEIVWRERELYVSTVLGGADGGGVEAYVGTRVPASR